MSRERTLTTGQRIAFARQEAGWTQRQLADAYNAFYADDITARRIKPIYQPAIARYEKGSTAAHSSILDRIMQVLRNAGATIVTDSVDGVLGIQARSAGKLVPVLDLMAKPTPKEWFADGFIARKFVTAVAGQEGAGKTMLAQSLIVAWANGDTEAFSFRLPGRQLRVLVVDVENVFVPNEDDIEPSLVTERLQAYGLTEESAKNVTVVGCLGFDLDKDIDSLDGILSEARRSGNPYDVVVLDSFRSLAMSTNENTADAGRVLVKVNRLAYTHNVAVVVLMHSNKAGAAYAGHTSIGSTVAAVWTFSKLATKDPNTGKKAQHKTARYLHPYKVRIAAEPQGRILATSAVGITSPKSAEEYAGFDIDTGVDDTEGAEPE